MGRVWSIRRQRTLKGVIDAYGYRKVALCWKRNSPGGEQRQVAIHGIEAEAFLGPRPEGQVVRHLDGDPLNLAITNLAYGTHAENLEDEMRHGTALNLWRKQRAECINGHTYAKVGFYINGAGARVCKQCDREKTARFLAKKRANAA